MTNNDNNFSFYMANATAQPYKLLTYSMQHTTTACHAEQQQQPAFARGKGEGVTLPETTSPSFANCSGRPGFHLASIHQMAPPKRGVTHLITA